MALEPTSSTVISLAVEALALSVSDDALLKSATLTVNVCAALLLPLRLMALLDETEAATPPAEHRVEVVFSSSLLAAAKSIPGHEKSSRQ
jgi:ABC-type molybdate transport system substrate-binding protein